MYGYILSLTCSFYDEKMSLLFLMLLLFWFHKTQVSTQFPDLLCSNISSDVSAFLPQIEQRFSRAHLLSCLLLIENLKDELLSSFFSSQLTVKCVCIGRFYSLIHFYKETRSH